MPVNPNEITDAEIVHMNYVQRRGIPAVQRVVELKRKVEKRILDAHSIGGEDLDALDTMSVLNEWIMVHLDARLMQAFAKIAASDVQLARNSRKEN